MYKATREFIKRRQQYCEIALEVVSVDRRPTMARGRCQDNAQKQIIGNEDLILLASGWLIYPYDSETNSTEIVQHWWNFSVSEKKHFDTTIGEFDDCEYLLDLAMYEYASVNYDMVASTIGKSLWLKDGRFQTVEKISGTLFYGKIESLKTKNLFSHL